MYMQGSQDFSDRHIQDVACQYMLQKYYRACLTLVQRVCMSIVSFVGLLRLHGLCKPLPCGCKHTCIHFCIIYMYILSILYMYYLYILCILIHACVYVNVCLCVPLTYSHENELWKVRVIMQVCTWFHQCKHMYGDRTAYVSHLRVR